MSERLRDTILRDDQARVDRRDRQQAEHDAQRDHVLAALRAAVAPGTDTPAVTALAAALDVDAGQLAATLRELLTRGAA